MSKLKLIKQLEYFIAFQVDCLANGNWEDFDKTENEIKKLEERILNWSEDGIRKEIIPEAGGGYPGNLCRDYEICRQ